MLGFIGKDYAGTGNGSSVITVNLFNMAANAAYEGTLPNVTQTADGPSGAAVATTAGNGFALYDSDLMCSGNQNAYIQIATPVSYTHLTLPTIYSV